MNAKLWVCVLFGVLVAHLAVLIIWDNLRTIHAPRPKPLVPTFETSTITFTDPQGETVKVLSEFTVQTELATPDMLNQLPAPPLPGVAEPAKKDEAAAPR